MKLLTTLALFAFATLHAVAGTTVCAPVRLLPPYADRAAWASVAKANKVSVPTVTARAEAFVARPIPPFPRELFLDFRRKGERWPFEAANNARWARLFALAYAELLEGKGRFLAPVAEALGAVCDNPTWVLSAHDRSLENVEGRGVSLDLASVHRAWQVAELTAAFGEALPEAVRTKAFDTARARAVEPYLRMVDTGKSPWWANAASNWNAVCHAGVVGTALALPNVTAEARATLVAAAKPRARRYLRSFTKDGWTSEGVGYWNYGFGHFAILSELVRRSTGGQEDWLLWSESRAPALTLPSLCLGGNVYPALADCPANVAADPRLADFLARRLGAPSPVHPVPDGNLPFPQAFLFPVDPKSRPMQALPPITWLEEAQLLVGRAQGMAFFAYGADNGAPHNHNDVGTFGITLEGVPVLADLGGESYTARTFSGARYKSPLLNSYGHPVPRPDGTLQASGKSAAAKVLAAEFGEGGKARLVLDLASAYRLKGLKTLTREFLWEPSVPALTVTDRFAFDTPRPFETALTGWGTCTRDNNTLRLTFQGKTLEAHVSASGTWVLATETIPGDRMVDRPCAWMDWSLPEDGIPENSAGKALLKETAHRFGLTLTEPAAEGTFTLRFSLPSAP